MTMLTKRPLVPFHDRSAKGQPGVRVGLAMLLLSLGVASGAAGSESVVDRLAQDMRSMVDIPGLALAIWEDGEIVRTGYYGFADVESQEPVDADTRFRAASVSKLMTVTALAKLVEAGKIDLDEPIDTYLGRLEGAESFPGGDVITARQLAGHLSGIAHYQPVDEIARFRAYDSVAESLDTFRDSPRAGEPGEQYVYSTHGYTLLSAVIEGAAGKPFLDYLAEGVFAPLGMTHSGPDLRPDTPPEMSTLYLRNQGKTFPVPMAENPSYKWGGGGLVSNPVDLVRLAAGYYEGFLEPQTITTMFTSQKLPDGEETGVGLGWRIGTDRHGRQIRHHAGSMGGARSVLVLYPEERAAVSVMVNMAWSSQIERTAALLRDAFDAERAAAAEGNAAESAADGPQGHFEFAGTFSLTSREGDETSQVSGSLELAGDRGTLGAPAVVVERFAPEAPESLPLHRLAADRWVIVTPFGLAPLELRVDGDEVRLEVDLASDDVLEITARAAAVEAVN